jgi:hypothetical protein
MTEFADVVDDVSEDELDEAWLGLYTAEDGAEFDDLVQALGELRLLDLGVAPLMALSRPTGVPISSALEPPRLL